MEKAYNVTFGAFADRNDGRGVFASLLEFVTIYFPVNPRIILRIKEKDKVVYRDDAFDGTGSPDIERQFVAQPVVNVNASGT